MARWSRRRQGTRASVGDTFGCSLCCNGCNVAGPRLIAANTRALKEVKYNTIFGTIVASVWHVFGCVCLCVCFGIGPHTRTHMRCMRACACVADGQCVGVGDADADNRMQFPLAIKHDSRACV